MRPVPVPVSEELLRGCDRPLRRLKAGTADGYGDERGGQVHPGSSTRAPRREMQAKMPRWPIAGQHAKSEQLQTRGEPSMSVASISPQFETATFAKVSRRLIPFLFLCYIVAFLDRVNVGFAKLQMASDLQVQRRRLQRRRRHILHRLLHLRGAEQRDPGADRRAHLDRPDHDHLGDHLLGHDVHASDSVGPDRTAVRS